MQTPAWIKQSECLSYQAFVFLFSFAVSIHSTLAVWLSYSFSQSAFVASIIIVLRYLPSALIGIFFSAVVNPGKPLIKLHVGNTILATSSLALIIASLYMQQLSLLMITMIGLVQAILSLVKLSNQSALGVMVRHLFDRQQGQQMIQLTASNSLVAQAFGTGVAGLMLSADWSIKGLIISIVLYLLASLALHCCARHLPEHANTHLDTTPQTDNRHRRRSVWQDRSLLTILLFSFPSSGAFQFLAALLAPLGSMILANDPRFFSLLSILSMVGGFLAGVLLSSRLINATTVLNTALPLIALFSFLLACLNHPLLVSLLTFLLSLVATTHVVCMQVKANQVPAECDIARYIIIRSAVVSVAKISFSLTAGALASFASIAVALHTLAILSLLFATLWFVVQPEWRADSVSALSLKRSSHG